VLQYCNGTDESSLGKMGVANSIDYVPQRHLHLSFASTDTNPRSFWIDQLIEQLSDIKTLRVTSTDSLTDITELHHCEFCIVYLDKMSLSHYRQSQELDYICNKGTKVLYLVLENDEAPYRRMLQDKDWIQLSNNNNIEEVKTYIRTNLGY